MIKSKSTLVLTVSILLGVGGASLVRAFKIDFLTIFVPFGNIPHIGQPVHEEITRDALTNVTPAASLALIANLQHGVQNADIIHQFDSESHFDNCSVFLFLGMGFSNGFATMTRRFESARQKDLVHWTATDSCGNSTTCNQIVVVVDLEPPRIVCSTNRAVAATSSSGAKVVFPTPPVSDNCPGVSVICIPTSGITFPIGTHTVLCTTSDASDNQAACSFTIRVKGAAEQIRDLTVLIRSIHLAYGMEISLNSKLRSALEALSVGNKATACDSLQSFINHASAQSGRKLTESQASSLIAAARQIKMVIKGGTARISRTINASLMSTL